MEDKLLCESDYRFMDVIWRHELVGSTELVNLCNAELGWKKSTTYTIRRDRGWTTKYALQHPLTTI